MTARGHIVLFRSRRARRVLWTLQGAAWGVFFTFLVVAI